ncbi:MAG: DUF58 domain-containing protein [Chloroflexi bacterium]|nr:DUF58 domain-containing protein [Chloroflexota bacterium]
MKTRTFLIAVAIPLILLALALMAGFVLMWRLFSLSIVVLVVGYLWAFLGRRGLDGEVKTSAERCQVGESLGEETTIVNRSKVPKMLVRVQEDTDFPGHNNAAAFNLPAQGSYHWRTKVTCQRRGLYSLGSLTATITDPLGIFALRRKMGKPQSILVYPATPDLPYFQLSGGKEMANGPSHWSLTESTPNAARVREYVSGDRLNRIHWPTTAHRGNLVVKEFDPDHTGYASRNIFVIPDMHQGSQHGDGDGATEEYCATIAAALIKKYIENDKQVGLIAAAERPYFFQPQTGNQHFWQMMEALALMKATGEEPIDHVISREAERFGIDSTVIIVTPSVSRRIASSVRHMKRRGATVVAVLLDSITFGGTAGAANIASGLMANGLQVYIVRHGDDLAKALDSRVPFPHLRHAGHVK